MAEAFPAVASSSGTLSALTVFVDQGTTATSLSAGVYDDAGGRPGRLLAQGSAAPAAGSWNSVDLSAELTGGTTYWIALLGSGGRLRYYASRGGTTAFASEQGNLTSLPDVWKNGQAYREGPVSAYGVGTVASEAIPAVDSEPPTAPGELVASDVSADGLTLSWAPSSDDVGVVGYEVSLNGDRLTSTDSASVRLSGLTCATSYSVGVVSLDAVGNRSPVAAITVATAACPSPVTLLGTASLGANEDGSPAGVAEAFRATAVASGTVSSLLVYVDSASTATKLVAGIYADDGGSPGALLGQGSAAASAGGWSSLSLSVEVAAGSDYWIAVLSPDGELAYRDTSSGSTAYASAESGLESLPSDWKNGNSSQTAPLSAYAVGIPG